MNYTKQRPKKTSSKSPLHVDGPPPPPPPRRRPHMDNHTTARLCQSATPTRKRRTRRKDGGTNRQSCNQPSSSPPSESINNPQGFHRRSNSAKARVYVGKLYHVLIVLLGSAKTTCSRLDKADLRSVNPGRSSTVSTFVVVVRKRDDVADI